MWTSAPWRKTRYWSVAPKRSDGAYVSSSSRVQTMRSRHTGAATLPSVMQSDVKEKSIQFLRSVRTVLSVGPSAAAAALRRADPRR